MSAVPTNFEDGSGETCAFRQCFEALVGQLPTECEKMAKSDKMQKHRFVHAVMALANAGGVPGERMKTSHKAPLGPSDWEKSQSLELDGIGLISRPAGVDGKGWDFFGSSLVDEDARRRRRDDPIGEAVKVLRDTTKMLGQMLNDWRAAEGSPGNGGEDDDAIWPSRHRKGSATASPTTALDTEAPALFARLSPMPTAQTEKDFEVETKPCRRTHGAPLSAIIGFPSELRRYRMMEGPWEEIPEGATH
ncbi:hypothetical protein GPALN_012874 [Globodera pallida]|nr:hypothetical protein GPALN_012874 [Globodera pallida]